MQLVDGNNWHWRCEDPLLSVLILTIPSRAQYIAKLLASLDAQKEEGVEVIVNSDQRVKTIGAKRQEALAASKGLYVSFIDDDDRVSETFLFQILQATRFNPDVITFEQEAVINHSNPFKVRFSIDHPRNQPLSRRPDGNLADIQRKPFHMCAWRGDIARRHPFNDISWGEDWAWCASMLSKDVRTEYHIEEVLHFYEFNQATSESIKR